MTQFSTSLLLMYLHTGRYLTAHTHLILALAALSVAVIIGFLWRGRHHRRRETPTGERQFPTNLLDVYPHPQQPPRTARTVGDE